MDNFVTNKGEKLTGDFIRDFIFYVIKNKVSEPKIKDDEPERIEKIADLIKDGGTVDVKLRHDKSGVKEFGINIEKIKAAIDECCGLYPETYCALNDCEGYNIDDLLEELFTVLISGDKIKEEHKIDADKISKDRISTLDEALKSDKLDETEKKILKSAVNLGYDWAVRDTEFIIFSRGDKPVYRKLNNSWNFGKHSKDEDLSYICGNHFKKAIPMPAVGTIEVHTLADSITGVDGLLDYYLQK